MDLTKIKQDCELFANELGLVLYNLEYKKEQDTNVLEFTIDKKGFVDMDDVEAITEKINEYLDKEDPISEDYNLSVTSRGCEKEFDFDDSEYYLNEWVDIRTLDQLFKGELVEKTSDSVTIKNIKNKKVKINVNDIVSMQTVIKF